MNLRKKKRLIARTLKIGVKRVKLDSEMREEIKEAITRQDIKDLRKEKIIKIKEKSGIKKKQKRKTKKRMGSRKKKINRKKQDYVKLTRKLRGYVKKLKEKGEITKEEYYEFRKKIRVKKFSDFSHLKTAIKEEKEK
tara:strand:+ start:1035 stop:1445 length:411 start_codon:yes stop_codon:yes gene_type:complete